MQNGRKNSFKILVRLWAAAIGPIMTLVGVLRKIRLGRWSAAQ